MDRGPDKRFPYLAEIVIESASGRREARIGDISHGGCYVDSIVEIHPGEEVSFHFKDLDKPLTFHGVVVYTLQGVGFGVKFTDLDEAAREHLESILKGFES